MKSGGDLGRNILALGWLAVLLGALVVPARADSLNWRKDKDSVDADINSWSLIRTLEAVAESTGWQVYLEPGTQRKVSTKFKDRSKDRALDLLLGNLGRVLLPGTNGGPARLLVFRNNREDATRLIRARARKGKAIPNELIVRMKKGKKVDDLASKLGAKIIGRSELLNSGRLQFADEEAAEKAREALIENEEVESVDPNFPVAELPTLESGAGGGSATLNLRPIKEGDPLVIGLIDTAVQKMGNNFDDFLLPGISVAGEAASPSDAPTHGTSMFETLLKSIDAFTPDGSATPVKVLPVDVYGKNEQATTYEVAEGIALALKAGATVVNLSLGSDGDTSYLHFVIKQGTEAGAVFVASAGNTPTTAPMYPAAYPEVNAITAGNSPSEIAPYANVSPSNDAMAPGTARVQFNNLNWLIQGTSPAAAYFSGAVAVGVANGLTPAQAAVKARQTFPLPNVTRAP